MSEDPERSPDEEPPRPPDETGDDAPPADPGPGHDEPIDDPFPRETIRYAAGEEPILGVTLDGPKVGKHSIDVFTFGEFLAQLDRVVRGLTATLEGITLAATGRIPRPPEAAPWRTVGLAFENSATIDFVLGEPEATRMSEAGDVTSPTIEAVVALGRLVGLEPADAVEAMSVLDDRIGNDFADLLALLADNDLASRWRATRTPAPIAVPTERADRVRNALRAELEPVTSVVTVSGFLFRLDAKSNDFKLQPEEGPAVTGSYDDSLVSELRDAWSHRVVAELSRTEQRYAYATEPFKVTHSLRRIVRKLGRVEGDDEAAG